ncbi:AHH domain-containing protein [Erythrobacter sp. JGD-13]|uniref:AHH domain-containing protein n=2 Tax=Aurantiacibacter sediminis TaxID=2793064 RepID=A0ABS0N3G2_9SPHN|nr:AHH domain-containing protein [Aurantiacibacter sediminis]
MQRHHLLPREVVISRCFRRMSEVLGRAEVGYSDFRRNGLLLPATVAAAMRTTLPLHRGPHRRYNEMVATRVGQIEASWSRYRRQNDARAGGEALTRLRLLQRALRRGLMQREHFSMRLNRKDPFRAGVDFAELDGMAEQLWAASAIATET